MNAGHWLVAGATLAVIVACVLLHYEMAITLSRLMEKGAGTQRRRFLVLIFGLLGAHIAEIWLFGLTAWLLLDHPLAGSFVGFQGITFLDHVYLSAVTYTTLGYGDLVPQGPIRFLMGTEALTGFMLITWSASLTFIEMQKHWEGGR